MAPQGGFSSGWVGPGERSGELRKEKRHQEVGLVYKLEGEADRRKGRLTRCQELIGLPCSTIRINTSRFFPWPQGGASDGSSRGAHLGDKTSLLLQQCTALPTHLLQYMPTHSPGVGGKGGWEASTCRFLISSIL